MGLEIVVLAAGHSTRMNSRIPKVLHKLAGRHLLEYVIDQAQALEPMTTHVVVSKTNQNSLRESFDQESVNWVLQEEQLGTGHAVLQALSQIPENCTLLILYGDVPLLKVSTLRKCVSLAQSNLTVLSARVSEPGGYGRIIRDGDGDVAEIVEERDLEPGLASIDEINSGIIGGPVKLFRDFLPQLDDDNKQAEFYLTDLIGLARTHGNVVKSVLAENEIEIQGVNSRKQLAHLEGLVQREKAEELMDAGVSLSCPESLRIEGELIAGIDCEIDANVRFEGKVTLGENVTIGPNCVIKNVVIKDHVKIHSQTMIEGATIGDYCEIGPSARLRPGSVLHRGVRIGNFVEVKNATLEAGVKAGHLAYIGDAYIGANTNIGAGAITCNFDGTQKHRTVIGKNAFIGTNCSLVAPLHIEDGVFVAAGTTVNKTKIEAGNLAVARPDLKVIPNWSKRRGLLQSDET